MHSRYHPGYPSAEGSLRTSNKVLPCNGSPRIPLLTQAFTGPTQEPEHPKALHRLTPPAGSLKQLRMDVFSIKVIFRSICAIKSQNGSPVNWKNEQFSAWYGKMFWREKHLTFGYGHGIMSTIWEKGVDEDGQTKRSPESRRAVRAGGFQSKDPSLPSRRTERHA